MKRSMKIVLSVLILMSFIATSLGLTSIAVKSIKLNAASVKISAGKTYRLKVTFTPANSTNKKVTFSSADRSIATVSSTGYIKGIKAGKTVITVTSASNKKAVARCNVTISQIKNIQPSEISFWVYPWDDKMQENVDKLLSDFNTEKPEIKVKTEIIPWDGGPNKVNVAIASSTNPDIIIDTTMRTLAYADKGVLAPVDDVIESIKDNMTDPAICDVGLLAKDKKRYAVPFGITYLPLAINVSLAKELGSDKYLPKDFESWEWEQFYNFLKASTKNGVNGIGLWAGSQSSDIVIFEYLWNSGGLTWNEDRNKIIINSEGGVEGLEWLVRFVKEGIAAKGAPTLKDEEIDALWLDKKTVVNQGQIGYIKWVQTRIADGSTKAPFDAQLFMFPTKKGVKKAIQIGNNSISVFGNQTDKNKIDAAKELAKYLAGSKSKVLKDFFIGYATGSPRKDYSDNFDSDPIIAKEYKKLANWTKYFVYSGIDKPYWSEIRAIFYPEIQAAYAGVKTPKQALDDFVKKANEIVDKYEKK